VDAAECRDNIMVVSSIELVNDTVGDRRTRIQIFVRRNQYLLVSRKSGN